MNRHDTKCAELTRYKMLAEAQAVASNQKLKHAAYPCDCGGFHVVQVEPNPPTARQKRRAEIDAYYGDMLRFCRATIDREISRYKAAGLRYGKRTRVF